MVKYKRIPSKNRPRSAILWDDLVKYKGILGIVTAPCAKRWAKPADVWVLWSNKRKPIVESGDFMELVNAAPV